MPKAKRKNANVDTDVLCNILPLELKYQGVAKTSKEQLYFQKIQEGKKQRYESRFAKLQSHKTDSLLACVKCKKRNVAFNDRPMRSSDEGSIMVCLCKDCGKTFCLS